MIGPTQDGEPMAGKLGLGRGSAAATTGKKKALPGRKAKGPARDGEPMAGELGLGRGGAAAKTRKGKALPGKKTPGDKAGKKAEKRARQQTPT